jgi:hypothetical protein
MITKKKLKLLVDEYIEHKRDGKIAHLKHYVGKDLEEVLPKLLRGGDDEREVDPHQRRLNGYVYDEVKEVLEAMGLGIFVKCPSFSHIFTHINNCRVSGFGRLAVYDAALRVGAMHGMYPADVYVQQGSEEGAKKLGLEIGDKNIVKYANLPAPLKRLDPFEVENFLCIFKNRLN